MVIDDVVGMAVVVAAVVVGAMAVAADVLVEMR